MHRLPPRFPHPLFERLCEVLGDESKIGMLKGCCAVLKIAPTFHPNRHLQGTVLDLEPTFAKGSLEQILEETRFQLMREGIFDRQRRLAEPADIMRIGVIHPEQSAGYADVQSELEMLERSGIATSVSFPAVFEGPGAQQSLCDALKRATEVTQGEGLDVLLLIRGGGYSAGLASLIFEDVAHLICMLPVPVITGLGHATDRTLLDEVAWHAVDTPSKAIGLVLALLRDRADRVMIDYSRIRKITDRVLRRQTQGLRVMRDQILRHVQAHIQHQGYEIQSARQAVDICQTFVQNRLTESQQDLDRLKRAVIGGQGPDDHYLEPLPTLHSCPMGLLRAALDREGRALGRLRKEILQSLQQALECAFLSLDAVHREVRALSIEGTLVRGFTLILGPNRRPVRHVDQIGATPLTIALADGAVAIRCGEIIPTERSRNYDA